MIELICRTCGATYKVKPYMKDKSKYCSEKCCYADRKGRHSKGHMITEEIRVKIIAGTKGIPKSKEHIQKIKEASKGKHSGDNSNFWKGGISTNNCKLQLLIRNMSEYLAWRKTVLKRDNFVCQHNNCKCTTNKLNVHHIKPFHVILTEYNILTIEDALKCEELWDINNGIVLCKVCHKTIYHYKKYKIL